MWRLSFWIQTTRFDDAEPVATGLGFMSPLGSRIKETILTVVVVVGVPVWFVTRTRSVTLPVMA